MAIRILTKNTIENTNIDGARANHFAAGMQNGIVKGAFSEGTFYASSTNTIALDPCELRISGHQIVIDATETITMSNTPSADTQYSMIAQIVVDSNSVPTFSLLVQTSSTSLTQNNLFANSSGAGTYQIEIGTFTLTTAGIITNVVKTIGLIVGGAPTLPLKVPTVDFLLDQYNISSSGQTYPMSDYSQYDFILIIGTLGSFMPTVMLPAKANFTDAQVTLNSAIDIYQYGKLRLNGDTNKYMDISFPTSTSCKIEGMNSSTITNLYGLTILGFKY